MTIPAIRFIRVTAMPLVALAATLSLLPLLGVSASPSAAQSNKGQSKMAPAAQKQKAKISGPVYACKMCKTYVSAATAKTMGNKDPMGHKLTKMTKAPAGFTDTSKMGGSKMGAPKAASSKPGDNKTGEQKTSQSVPAPTPLEKVVVNTCPISGKKIEGEGVGMTVVDNYEVHFCCPNCKPAFDKMTKEQQLEKVKAVLAKS